MDNATTRGAEALVPDAGAVAPDTEGVQSDARSRSAPASTTTRPRRDAIPPWLARTGWSAWTMVGVAVAAVAVALAATVLVPMLAPVIVAGVLAAVLLPLVGWLSRRRVPRALAALLAALLVPALVAALVAIVVRGLRGQSAQWEQAAATAGERLTSILGFDPLSGLLHSVDGREILLGLASLLASGAAAAISLGLGTLLGVYVLFFLLKDAPRFADFLAARIPLPPGTTRDMLGTARLGLSRYMVGTTVVAAMDAVVISLGALLLGLPLIVVIALVTFAAAYVPYLGAWVSGAFAVVVALGSGGGSAALWMLGIVLVTQNVLEGVLRPLAFGFTLKLHPLTVLAATVAGAALGGVVGVFIAPPVTAIAVSWVRTIRDSRAALPEPADDAAERSPQPRDPPR